MVDQLFDDYLKINTFSTAIEAFVNRWVQLNVDNLENGLLATAEHVGQMFEVI